MDDGTTAHDGLIQATEIDFARFGRQVNFNVKRNFVVAVDLRNHVHIDTCVQELELSADEGIDTDGTDAG